jgi:cytochrome c553
MKRFPVAALVTGSSVLAVCVGLAGSSAPQSPTPRAARPISAAPATQTSAAIPNPNDTIKTYCVGCHNDKVRRGELSLAAFDVLKAGAHADIAEKVVRKLRTGMMPPREASRKPDAATRLALVTALETTLDAARSSGSIARSTPPRSALSLDSISTSANICLPTRSAQASTILPTCRCPLRR